MAGREAFDIRAPLRLRDRDRRRKAEGGKIKMALSPGGSAGWFTDKFGINWMMSIDKA